MEAHVICGLAYGDEGKGSMTAWAVEATKSRLVVRYNGGPQSSHHVVLPDGRSHGFAQFGAGTFAGARTYLSRHMLIEPFAMANEAFALQRLGIPFPGRMVAVDADCLVITPWHWRLNRLREAHRGKKRHGSCGMGLGEARYDELMDRTVVRAKDLMDCEPQLREIRDQKYEEARASFGKAAAETLAGKTAAEVQAEYRTLLQFLDYKPVDGMPKPWIMGAAVIFEGAQGLLLDEEYGFAPYNTWTNCTAENAVMVARAAGIGNIHIIGVLPAVFTRHGAGPFVSEYRKDTMTETHNVENLWQGKMRHGYFDAVATRYALRSCPVHDIALTMVDRLPAHPMMVCNGYAAGGMEIDNIFYPNSKFVYQSRPVLKSVRNVEELGALLGTPVRYVSTGPLSTDKIDLGGAVVERDHFHFLSAAACS